MRHVLPAFDQRSLVVVHDFVEEEPAKQDIVTRRYTSGQTDVREENQKIPRSQGSLRQASPTPNAAGQSPSARQYKRQPEQKGGL